MEQPLAQLVVCSSMRALVFLNAFSIEEQQPHEQPSPKQTAMLGFMVKSAQLEG